MERSTDVTNVFLCLFLVWLLFFLIKYNWNRRWLYYHSWTIPGPLALPLIGNGSSFIGGPKVLLQKLGDMINIYPEIFRIWIGKYFLIVISKPEDVENIFNNYVEKGPLYKWTKTLLKDSLLISPGNIWKKHRKIINPTFNPQILKTFPIVFEKHSKRLVKIFESDCGKDIEVSQKISLSTFDMACEALLDIDVDKLTEQNEQISRLIEAEDIFGLRACKPWLYLDRFWKLSSLYRRVETISFEMLNYIEKIVHMKKVELPKFEENNIRKKLFLNHLLALNSKSDNYLCNNAILEETNFMIIAASETIALTVGFVLLVLGLFPDIQQKVYDELYSIFGNSSRNITSEDLIEMGYLERVIKETMRMFPPVPFVMRELDKDHHVRAHTLPAGSIALIPIYWIHKNPNYWNDPETFNPDRFKPENFAKMPRGSYIPFSDGPRNCIGFTYGFMSIKVILSTLLRSYKVAPPVDYASLADIKLVYIVLSKPNKNFRVKLERRS